MESHERPAYGALALGGVLGLVGLLLGLWAGSLSVPSDPDAGVAAGLAGAALLLVVLVAGTFLLLGLGLAGVGWWALRTGRTRVPSVALGAGLGFVGTGLLTPLVPSLLLLAPVAALVGGFAGHRLSPAPAGSEG